MNVIILEQAAGSRTGPKAESRCSLIKAVTTLLIFDKDLDLALTGQNIGRGLHLTIEIIFFS